MTMFEANQTLLEQAAFKRIRRLVRTGDYRPNDSCHQRVKEIELRWSTLYPEKLIACTGLYAGIYDHSWLRLPSGVVIDVYPVGQHPEVIMVSKEVAGMLYRQD